MIEAGQTWRHVKRGSVYMILHVRAKVQVSSLDSEVICNMLEAADWVCYTDGSGLYFRMRDEFLDGRFERV